MSRWGESGLRVETFQMQGNCFGFYVRTPEMWNGARRIFHMHKGPHNTECEPCCDGYNEAAAKLILLLSGWLDESAAAIVPKRQRRNLDAVVAEIAKGLNSKKPRRQR